MIKTTLTVIALGGSLASIGPAQAACFADYKAKKTAPLSLHYGVIKLPDAACGKSKVTRKYISNKISVGGWKLLNVMSEFGPEGLSQRQGSAGAFFLKF